MVEALLVIYYIVDHKIQNVMLKFNKYGLELTFDVFLT